MWIEDTVNNYFEKRPNLAKCIDRLDIVGKIMDSPRIGIALNAFAPIAFFLAVFAFALIMSYAIFSAYK